MPTKNPRLNIVLEEPLYASLKHISQMAGTSLSLTARDLIREAIAEYEDSHWLKIAEEREKTFSPKKAIDHKNLWKK